MRSMKRWVASALAVILCCRVSMTGYAQADPYTCDETLYLTLDSEGRISESSVVKRYEVHEDGQITDFGTYESVANLTSAAEAVKNDDGSVSFPVRAEDGAFYFEGKTAVLMDQLPWTVKVRYLLNGVEMPQENLAGEKGLIEICADIIPNENVSEYFRNNMALTMTTLVNTDDVLSLRAEGAQLQTVGSMSAVVYFALPGEECHYTIAIGSDDFTFSGLIFMMVPLTVKQVEKVGELKEAKETLESSKDAINDSMDVILNTMEQMRAGIAETSSGLRGLDNARQIIHAGKDSVYAQADQAIEQLDALAESLKPFKQHTDDAAEALGAIRNRVNELTSDINELEPKLGDLKDTVRYLRDDITMIQEVVNSPQADYASEAFAQLLEKTKQDLMRLAESQQAMSDSIAGLGLLMQQLGADGESLSRSTALLDGLDLESDYDAAEIQELLALLQENTELVNDLEGSPARTAAQTPSDWTIPDAAKPALGQFIYTAAGFTGNTGIYTDIAGMIELTQQMLLLLESKKGIGQSVVHETKDLLATIGKISAVGEDICGDIDSLNQTLERHHPGTLSTLADLGKMTDRAASGIASLSAFFKTLEEQVKSAGGSLNEGTKATLNGLADVLDKAGNGLDQTSVLRGAKDTVIGTIDDKWDEFSGENTTILNLDPEAKPVSLTSDKNPSPRSMQIVMRTKEITKDDKEDAVSVDETYHPEGNIFKRIGMIFKKIWDAVCSIFQ